MASTTETKQHLFDVLKGFNRDVGHAPKRAACEADGSRRASARTRHVFLDPPAVAKDRRN